MGWLGIGWRGGCGLWGVRASVGDACSCADLGVAVGCQQPGCSTFPAAGDQGGDGGRQWPGWGWVRMTGRCGGQSCGYIARRNLQFIGVDGPVQLLLKFSQLI